MMRILWLLILVPGCFTGRLGAGPTLSGNGGAGLAVKAGGGMGYGSNEQAVYLTADVGLVAGDAETTAVLIEGGVDYVSERGAGRDGLPLRAGLHWGARLATDGSGRDHAMFGGSVALFPFSKELAGDHGGGHEKFGRLTPEIDAFRNLGFELGVKRLFAEDHPDEWLFTLAFVAEWSTMLD